MGRPCTGAAFPSAILEPECVLADRHLAPRTRACGFDLAGREVGCAGSPHDPALLASAIEPPPPGLGTKVGVNLDSVGRKVATSTIRSNG